MASTVPSWPGLCLALLALLCGPAPSRGGQTKGHAHALVVAPENEVPLHPAAAWLPEGRVTTVRLAKGRTRRLYFTLKKKSVMMSVTVSPCDQPVEWTLAARTLKDKASKSAHWSSKKSMPEVWWRKPGTEAKIHTYTGDATDTYQGPSYSSASVYVLRLRPTERESATATVYLHDGSSSGPSGAFFPALPSDPGVRVVGVGMTSVTLSWAPSPALARPPPRGENGGGYCVVVNRQRNYRSLCAAREGLRKEREQDEKKEEKKERGRKVTPWPILKDWWWRQWDAPRSELAMSPADGGVSDGYGDLPCACRGAESVCTVSELVPDTRYYFDVFVTDGRLHAAVSSAYTGTSASTHEEARPAVATLREGELRWVTFRDGVGATSGAFFRFYPRGRQRTGLLTLQGCGEGGGGGGDGGGEIRVTVSAGEEEEDRVLSSQAVGEGVAQIWLEGSPSYLIHLEREGGTAAAPAYRQQASATSPAAGGPRASVKIQTTSAYHRRGPPALPSTLQVKSFNKLRTCNAVTLAWMGTEERSLYCVYRRRLGGDGEGAGAEGGVAAPCLGPESRPDAERALCKYYQELNPRRAVTTATIAGLEPGAAYVFDVYLVRHWGIAVRYASKTVRTRKEC